MNGESGHKRRGGLVLALAYILVILALAGLAAAVTFLGDPNAGRQVATLHIPARHIARAPAPLPVETPASETSPATEAPPGGETPAVPPGTAVPPGQTPPSGQTVPPAQTAAVPPAQTAAVPPAPPPPAPPPMTGSAAVANPALIEKTPQGPLPRIADNGLSPMRAYGTAIRPDGKPRIAIVIRGLGISARSTSAAIDGTPPGVTLAFAPYANDVQNWVAAARKKGHEVLLEVPMEPYDFPDSDPGQYTLRTGVGEDTNTKKLVWSLTRFTGYVGITNLLGGKLLSDAGALEPMLTYLNRRGLLFFDNGSAMHSVAPDVAARVGVPFSQATLTVDSIQSAMEIDHRLSDLEAEARSKGSAVGAGFLYPVTLERVANWSRGLSGRGFVLAPISAIVATGKK